MVMTLGELAEHIGATLRGDPGCAVHGVATLDSAGEGDVTFLFNRRYRKWLHITRATAVILAEGDLDDCAVSALVTENPYLGYARAAALLAPRDVVEPGVHPCAWVSPEAAVDASASIGPQAVIESGARIGQGVYIGPGCSVGRDAVVGDFSRLVANVTVCHGVKIGNRTCLHPGVVIGADGFGLARDQGRWIKIPQLGAVQIGNDVEIGANTTVDRGALKDTVVEDGVKLDNQIQIGHNVRIGEHTAIAACTGISGSTTIGKRCTIGGGVGMAGHLDIADDVTVLGGSNVTKSIRAAGTYTSVWPAEEKRSWWRKLARFNRLGRASGHGNETN